jgi:ankyrin repeat protein
MKEIKYVMMGDCHLLEGLLSAWIPIDNCTYTKRMKIEGRSYLLALRDTSNDYDLRPFSSGSDAYILIFSVVNRRFSFDRITLWYSRLVEIPGMSECPIILVGMQSELRHQVFQKRRSVPVSYEEGVLKAKEIKAAKYLECSTATLESVNSVFEKVTRVTIFGGFIDLPQSLFDAVICNEVETVKELLKDPLINIPDMNRALIFATRYDHLSLVFVLKEHHAELTATDETGNTPLLVAAANGDITLVEFFCSQGAELAKINQEGESALYLAILHDHFEVMEYLIAKGMTLTDKEMNKIEKISFHIEANSETALHKIAAIGDVDLLRQLLAEGHDILAIAKTTGHTPLHVAILAGQRKCANELVRCGASLEVQDKKGLTPVKLIANSPLNQQYRWLEEAKYLAHTYRQEQQLRQAQLRSAHSKTFDEEKRLLQQQLHDFSEEDPFGICLANCCQALQSATAVIPPDHYQNCKRIVSTLQHPAMLVKHGQGSKVSKLSPKHPAFSDIQKICLLIDKLRTSLSQTEFSLLQRRLEEMKSYYQYYMERVCTVLPSKHDQLYRTPMLLYMAGVPARCLKEAAQIFFTETAAQTRNDSNAVSGTSLVKSFKDIHFKRDPHAPGVEFMVSTLASLLLGHGITPSEFIKVKDQQENLSWAYLASKTVFGVELGHIIREYPDYLRLIYPGNFSAMAFLSFLIDPQDGKPDNYMAELHYNENKQLQAIQIIGIDNDIAFGPPQICLHSSGPFHDQPFVTVKNVLYFFPQMQKPISPAFRQHFLKLNPAMLVLEWLQALDHQNNYFQQLLDEGIFTQEEFQGGKINRRGFRLPIRLRSQTVTCLYQKLVKLQQYLKEYPEATHCALFEYLEPDVCHYYQAIQHHAPNDMMECVRRLYADAQPTEEARQLLSSQLRSQQTSSLTQSVLESVELHKLEAQETQTIQEAVFELLSVVDYRDFDETDVCLWYEELNKFNDKGISHLAPESLYEYILTHILRPYNASLLDHLLIQRHLSLQTRYAGGNTLLHLAVQYKQREIVARLLETDIAINEANDGGYTPLHVAASVNDVEMLELLLKAGAEKNVIHSKTGESALDKALNRQYDEAARCLLKHGAKVYAVKHQVKVTELYMQVEPREGQLASISTPQMGPSFLANSSTLFKISPIANKQSRQEPDMFVSHKSTP